MTTKFFRYGGIVASIVLIAFGVGAVATGFSGRHQVRSDLAREQIVGTPDSRSPAGRSTPAPRRRRSTRSRRRRRPRPARASSC